MSQFVSMGAVALNHDALPRPVAAAKPLSPSMSKEQFLDYARQGYHYAVDRIGRGLMVSLWMAAANGYKTAHEVIMAGGGSIGSYSRLVFADNLAATARIASGNPKPAAPKAVPDAVVAELPPDASMMPPPPGAKKPPLLAIGAVGFGLWFLFGRKKKG